MPNVPNTRTKKEIDEGTDNGIGRLSYKKIKKSNEQMGWSWALQNFLLPTSKMSYGVSAYNFQSCVSAIMLDTVLFSLLFLSFFPLSFIFSFLFSIPSFPYFFFFSPFPPCLQNGVGAYERRSLARTLCRALLSAFPLQL